MLLLIQYVFSQLRLCDFVLNIKKKMTRDLWYLKGMNESTVVSFLTLYIKNFLFDLYPRLRSEITFIR